MISNLFAVSKYGVKSIMAVALLFVFLFIIDFEFLSFFVFVILLALVYIYRNPEKEISVFQKNSVISPVDGTVISVEEIDDSEYKYKIEIDNSYLDISLLRIPFSGKVEDIMLTHGTRFQPFSKLFNKLNENVEIVFVDDNSNRIKINHRVKKSFDDIKIELFKAQNIVQGKRYGSMVNGITTIYLPANFRINVKLSNQLSASETLIGYFS